MTGGVPADTAAGMLAGTKYPAERQKVEEVARNIILDAAYHP